MIRIKPSQIFAGGLLVLLIIALEKSLLTFVISLIVAGLVTAGFYLFR